jgi:hypothetical protein
MHTNITIRLPGRGEIVISVPSATVTVATGDDTRGQTTRLWLSRAQKIRDESPIEVIVFPTTAHFFEALFRWTRTTDLPKVCSTPDAQPDAHVEEPK